MDNVETITNIVNVGYLGVAPCTKIIRHVDASSLFYYPYIYMVIADDKYWIIVYVQIENLKE